MELVKIKFLKKYFLNNIHIYISIVKIFYILFYDLYFPYLTNMKKINKLIDNALINLLFLFIFFFFLYLYEFD